MDAILWIMLPLFTAAGSALLAFAIMQARQEVALAKEREALVEAHAQLRNHQREVEDRVRATEEETRRRSMDEFINDIRVEERHYLRESKSFFSSRKSMVLQERMFFRNIPLSNWVERELPISDSSDLPGLARANSAFASPRLPQATAPPADRLLT